MEKSPYTLPELPYSYDALEPVISSEIMMLHHQKHHAAYINNFNTALASFIEAEKEGNVAKMMALTSVLTFNGGGHVNHSFFWKCLAPFSSEDVLPSDNYAVITKIKEKWGSLDDFWAHFQQKALSVQGSGWCWLGINKRQCMAVCTTANQETLESKKDFMPLFGVDVWEHAYYPLYKNARGDYLVAIRKIINWSFVNENFDKAEKQVR